MEKTPGRGTLQRVWKQHPRNAFRRHKGTGAIHHDASTRAKLGPLPLPSYYHYHYQLLPITTSYHLFPLSHARLQQIQSSVSLSLITHRRKSCGSLFGKTQAGRVEDVAELVAAALTAPSCVNTEIAAGEPCANKARSERWGSRGQLTERSEGRFEKLSTCRQMHYTTVIRCTSCTSLQVHGAYRSGM